MKKRMVFFLALVSLLWLIWLAGCSGSGGNNIQPPPPVVSIAVSPSTATLQVGGTQQVTATVTGTSNTTVSWIASDTNVPAGTDIGSVNPSGLYTAPQWVASQLSVSVMATSAADPAKSATATITIQVPKQPVLLWQKVGLPGAFDAITFDPTGNVTLGGGGIITSYDTNGTLRWNYNLSEPSEVGGGVSLPDGSSLWAGSSGAVPNEIPMLLGITDSGQKLLENTCPTVADFGPMAEAANKIYIGGFRPPAVVTADQTGNIDCQDQIVVKNDDTAILTSLWSNGTYLLAAGFFSSSPPGSNLGSAGFAVKIDLTTRTILWERDFQDTIVPRVLATSENGQDVIYYTASIFPAGATNLFTFTTKLNSDGTQAAGWPQTYPEPLDNPSGNGALVPSPSGGVIVLGSSCTLINYGPDGTTRWNFKQNFSTIVACNAVVAVNNTFLYIGGSTVANQALANTLVAKFALPQ